MSLLFVGTNFSCSENLDRTELDQIGNQTESEQELTSINSQYVRLEVGII